MANDSIYEWAFFADNGDVWGGTLYADSSLYAAGDWFYDVGGYYYIAGETAYDYDISDYFGPAFEDGSVYTGWYYEALTASFLPTYSGGNYATGTLGLGSEYDYAWDGVRWDDFGLGGEAVLRGPGGGSDAVADALYDWLFFADSGDVYGGVTIEDQGFYAPGEYWFTPFGYYYIADAADYGRDLSREGYAEGLVWTDWYYDGDFGAYLPTASGGDYPTASIGLGGEYDYAWNGLRWDDFGLGGQQQATLFA